MSFPICLTAKILNLKIILFALVLGKSNKLGVKKVLIQKYYLDTMTVNFPKIN